MKLLTNLLLGAICCSAASCLAQPYVYPEPSAPAPVAEVPLSDSQIDQLTASIALYPDPLVAQILPAATYPLDIVSASQWLRANPSAPQEAIDAQPWDPSVKALAHYPTVLQMMADNIDWTQQLGEAYLNEPTQVMDSIQRLRAEAQAAGTLVSTPQQQVIVENGTISIVPAEPEIIYVPQYDPTIVYVRHREPARDLIRFGPGLHIGIWLDKDTDWHRHHISEGVHWDRDHRPGPPDVIVRDRDREKRQWTRDNAKPIVIHPERFDTNDHRGYAKPQPQAHGFGEYKPRQETEREENRGRQSLHQPAPRPAQRAAPPAKHAPEAHPAAREPAHPAAPARSAAPTPAPAPAHPESSDHHESNRSSSHDGGQHR